MNHTRLLGILAMGLCVMITPVLAQDIPDTNERQPEQDEIPGETDTPILPGTNWHVHDPNRPQPEVVTPHYDGEPVPPPEEATVLFDGSDLDHWTNKSWKLKDDYMIVTDGNQYTKKKFGDMYLHVEWMVPESIYELDHKRANQGNSGIFIMERYAVQVLDSWANRIAPDSMAGSLYGQKPPRVNACRKPGQWQSYDIFFTAPETENGEVIEPATVSALHNGIPIHNNVELLGATAHEALPRYDDPPAKGRIQLGYHGNPVRFRNIWVIPMDE